MKVKKKQGLTGNESVDDTNIKSGKRTTNRRPKTVPKNFGKSGSSLNRKKPSA